jgi:hypothetical protein
MKRGIMRITNLILFLALCLFVVHTNKSFGAGITLDFSSGHFTSQPPFSNINRYEQDGFSVRTVDPSHEFSTTFGTYGPTLAWYESETVIRVDAGGEKFSLLSIEIVTPVYAGLIFQSSRGGKVSVGNITGELTFTGSGWTDIEYFTITTQLNFNVLAELDNMVIYQSSDVIAGDCDGDDDVDGSDLAVFADDLANGTADHECNWDLNGSGDVDGDDIQWFATNFGITLL